MSTPEPPHTPEVPAPGGPEGPPAPAPHSVRRTGPPLWLWLLAILIGTTAGLLSWASGEQFLNYYKPTREALMQQQNFTPLNNELAIIVPRNTAIAYGGMGAILGAALGLLGGLSRRSIIMSLIGIVAGCVLGAAAGSLLSFALVPIYRAQVDPAEPTLMLPLLIHGGIWVAVGAAAGLAFGLGQGVWRQLVRALLGGAVGGMLGTILFEVLQAAMFPLIRATEVISEARTIRMMSYLCVAICVALLSVAFAGVGNPARSSPAAEPAVG